MNTEITVLEQPTTLPPILARDATPEMREQVTQFYFSVPEMFEAWVRRCQSLHTQRTYRAAVMHFFDYMQIPTVEEAYGKRVRRVLSPGHRWEIFQTSVQDVQSWRELMVTQEDAPKTRNLRICALNNLYTYLRENAAVFHIPVQVPNPAHRMHITRENASPVNETEALDASLARQLLALPSGESVFDYQERAILHLYVFGCPRLAEGCNMEVSDIRFRKNGGATFTITRKGGRRETHGLHFKAAEAIAAHIEKAGLTSGPLFHPQKHPKVKELGEGRYSTRQMHHLLMGYLKRLPGAMIHKRHEDGTEYEVCQYWPHSLRATGATLLLLAGVDVKKVQALLGHKDVNTTMGYYKRVMRAAEGASHDMPI